MAPVESIIAGIFVPRARPIPRLFLSLVRVRRSAMNAPLLTALLAEDSDTDRDGLVVEPSGGLLGRTTAAVCPRIVCGPRRIARRLVRRRAARSGRLVTGPRFTVRFADGDIYMGYFKLNLVRRPGTMACTSTKVQLATRAKLRCAFTKWPAPPYAGGRLPGLEERLTAFPAANDGQALVLHFRREQRG